MMGRDFKYHVPNMMRFHDTDLTVIFERLVALRGIMVEAIEQHLTDVYAMNVTEMIDRDAAEGTLHRPLTAYASKFDDKVRERKLKVKQGLRDPEIDLECTLAIIPYGGEVYGAFYTEHEKWFEVLVQHGVAEPYGVTDIGEDEFAQRVAIWEGIVQRDPNLRIMCLKFEFITSPGFAPDLSAIITSAPSFTARLRTAAVERIEGQAMAEHCRTLEGGEENHLNWMRGYRAGREYGETDEGQRRIEEEIERLRDVLPKFSLREFDKK